jgi:broad specificity phosphatase PhoE
MRIILLRHEERPDHEFGFYTNLTENGLKNTYILASKLEKYNIDLIFSSPYVRTLQTVYPFVKNNQDLKINVEYSLQEYLHNPYFLIDNKIYGIDDIYNTRNEFLIENINFYYKSYLSGNDLFIPENEINLENRVYNFMNNIIETYGNTDKTILLVSHKGIINKIKDIYYQYTPSNSNFDMGHFEVFNYVGHQTPANKLSPV